MLRLQVDGWGYKGGFHLYDRTNPEDHFSRDVSDRRLCIHISVLLIGRSDAYVANDKCRWRLRSEEMELYSSDQYCRTDRQPVSHCSEALRFAVKSTNFKFKNSNKIYKNLRWWIVAIVNNLELPVRQVWVLNSDPSSREVMRSIQTNRHFETICLHDIVTMLAKFHPELAYHCSGDKVVPPEWTILDFVRRHPWLER